MKNDGELIDDANRFGGDKAVSTAVYEEGMYRVFQVCHQALKPEGRFVIVFAHKNPDAWETLVSAIIRTGFVGDASWPIQTERGNRTRALASAALSSSVWLVCKKRPITARPGWDNRVLSAMEESITTRLRAFWDAGIRGPDFVWAATGPALQSYSVHRVVKKANEPNQTLCVSEFLAHARRKSAMTCRHSRSWWAGSRSSPRSRQTRARAFRIPPSAPMRCCRAGRTTFGARARRRAG